MDRGLLRGLVQTVEDLPSQKIAAFNPQTGPFHVEGAEPGDTLALHFVSIEPSRDWAMSTTFPLFGALTSTLRTVTLQDPLEEIVWRYDVDAAKRLIRSRRGTGSTRPSSRSIRCTGPSASRRRAGTRSSLVPDAHGGNMDTPEMRTGTTCYLGVNTSRARCSRSGTATAGRVRARPAASPWRPRWTPSRGRAHQGRATPWPRLETDNHVMSTGSARPLEDAFRIAHGDLVMWLVDEFGLDELDAYQLVSQIAESPVANVCDPNYTFVAKAPKRHLPSGNVYASTRQTLKEIAATYRAERGLG